MRPGLRGSFYIPVVFFLISFCADAAITSYALSLGAFEGNEIVVWLWSIFGTDSFLLKIIYIVLVLGGTYLLAKRNFPLGLWAIYSFAFGHLLGFLTWVTLISIGTMRLILYAMIMSLATVLLIPGAAKNKGKGI